MLTANNPDRKSWISTNKNTDFPIQNLPFGVFMTQEDLITIGTRIGDTAIDLYAMHQMGYLNDMELPSDVFLQDTLNDFITLGRPTWRKVRNRVAEIFDVENDLLQKNSEHQSHILFPVDTVQMLMPVFTQDYTDFYSSKEHAMNVGIMFRGKENALMPNWVHMPIGYHGRSSSIIVSGENIHRPKGQTMPADADKTVFGPCKALDIELEMAFITTDGKAIGESISVNEAEDYIFGMVLFNDWSARDLQKWEYQPLGPFLGKSFASSISPWVVTLDALEPYRTESPAQDPKPLDYLVTEGEKTFDINLDVFLTPENGEDNKISHSNFKHLYWNISQQLAHHTSNGCPINVGDMMGSGTISGPTPDSYGSLLELSWAGSKPLTLSDGSQRTYLRDGDSITIKGYSEKEGLRIGFGAVETKILPAL